MSIDRSKFRATSLKKVVKLEEKAKEIFSSKRRWKWVSTLSENYQMVKQG